ncbi:hypothetical protein PCE1_002675 [Barthelona sp. PCE]
MVFSDIKVYIRGAGEMASAIAVRLAKTGLKVLLSEVQYPLAVRRAVSFCTAVYTSEHSIEGIKGVLCGDLDEFNTIFIAKKTVGVLVDPDFSQGRIFDPHFVIDATLSKTNSVGTTIDMAPCVIALGPGYCAGKDCNFVVETNRGHKLGLLITEGFSAPNTGIPGVINGYSSERVLRAPVAGCVTIVKGIGEIVEVDEVVMKVDDYEVKSVIAGVVRGAIRSSTVVKKNEKIGDVDPRADAVHFFHLISDKARNISGSVLEIIFGQVHDMPTH